MGTHAGQCFTTLENVIYVERGPLHWGLSLHLIKVVNLKIPVTITAGLQQTVFKLQDVCLGMECFGGFGIIFLPLCDAFSCSYTRAKLPLAFSLQVSFMPSDPTSLGSSANITSEERYQSQSLFPQFLPVLPLASRQ